MEWQLRLRILLAEWRLYIFGFVFRIRRNRQRDCLIACHRNVAPILRRVLGGNSSIQEIGQTNPRIRFCIKVVVSLFHMSWA